jgi:hypothetical protein
LDLKDKEPPRSAEVLLNDVAIAYVYSFSFEEVDVKKVIDALNKRDYIKSGIFHSPKNASSNTNTSYSLVEDLRKYDTDQYFPEYLSAERIRYVELRNIKLNFRGQTLEAQVLLSLHEYGVGTLIFVFSNINMINFDHLRDLIFLSDIKSEYVSPFKSVLKEKPNGNSVTLTQVFGEILCLLERDTNIKIIRGNTTAPKPTTNSFSISEENYNVYVSVFISDPGGMFNTPEEFVKKNEKEMFELVTIRYHHKDNKYYYFSRSNAYIESIMKKLLGNRRHISYYLTEERMTAISLAKQHQDWYPYDYKWWIGYLSLLNVVRMQFQLLYKLYKRLYIRTMTEDPTKMIGLRRIIINGLEEYHNLRFPVNERTREFVEHCKEAMNLNRFYDVIEEKLDLITQSIEEYFDRESQNRSNATTTAVNLLTIILSLPAAIQIVDKFSVNPPIYYYFGTWFCIGLSYFVLQRILLWFASRSLKKIKEKT